MEKHRAIKELLPKLKNQCWNPQYRNETEYGLLYQDKRLNIRLRIKNNDTIVCEYPTDLINPTMLPRFCFGILDFFQNRELVVGEVYRTDARVSSPDIYGLIEDAEWRESHFKSDENAYADICEQIISNIADMARDNRAIDFTAEIERLNIIIPLSDKTWEYLYNEHYGRLTPKLQSDLKMKLDPQEVSFKDYMTSIGDEE